MQPNEIQLFFFFFFVLYVVIAGSISFGSICACMKSERAGEARAIHGEKERMGVAVEYKIIMKYVQQLHLVLHPTIQKLWTIKKLCDKFYLTKYY